MTIPPVTPGEPIDFSADVENAQRDFINLLMQAAGYDNGGFGSTGFSFLSGFAAPHAIFELKWTCNGGTCYVVWDPDDGSAPIPPGLDSVPDVPYSLEARRVWLNQAANTYGQANLSRDETLYFPLARDEDDVGGYSNGDRVPAWYDEQSGRWWSLNNPAELSSSSSGVETSGSSGSSSSGVEESSSSSGVEECACNRYVKVQPGWHAATGNGQATRAVDVRPCDWDGGNEGGAETDCVVNTLPHSTQDTALFDGTVFACEVAEDGTVVSRGDIYDDPIGTVKMWNKAVGAIRPGWRLCAGGATSDFTGQGGRFPKQRDGAEAVNATGGAQTHSHDDHPNNSVAAALAGHPHDNNHVAVAGTDADQTSAHNITFDAHSDHVHGGEAGGDTVIHAASNHVDPWTAVEFIERFE